MATTEERLLWLQQETNAWANGGLITKKEILEKGKVILMKERRECLGCQKKLDKFCRYERCRACRYKEKWELEAGDN